MTDLDGFSSVFLDTSFLVALFGREDAMHARAAELLGAADRAECRLCTIWDCLSEALTVLRRHFGYRPAVALADSLEDMTLVTYDTSHRLEAVARFRRRARRRPVRFVDILCSVVIETEPRGAP